MEYFRSIPLILRCYVGPTYLPNPNTHIAQNIAERCQEYFLYSISLQLKYCRNVFVKYCKIFHVNITV